MKKMIPVKILKSIWPALFAEIIVSDKRNVLIKNKLSVDLPILPKTWG